MIDKKGILEYLENEGLEEIDEIEYNKNVIVYNLFYSLDEAELEAAKDYANENCAPDKDEESWNEEFFLPYLTEIAADNVKDIIDDICEQYEVEGEFMVYELDIVRPEKCEFTIVLANKGTKFDIEEVMDELEL